MKWNYLSFNKFQLYFSNKYDKNEVIHITEIK